MDTALHHSPTLLTRPKSSCDISDGTVLTSASVEQMLLHTLGGVAVMVGVPPRLDPVGLAEPVDLARSPTNPLPHSGRGRGTQQ